MSDTTFDLSGKVALVTGGNGGIGLGMAEAMARAGADVCIWGTNAEKNAAAESTLAAHGTRILALSCDVGDPAAVAETFERTVAYFDRVDGCFANAGVHGAARSFLDITPEEWRRVMTVNLDGVFYTLQAAARHMAARAEAGDPGGRLVAVSSLAAVSGAARAEHYAATKGAVTSMIYALAVEFARHGVTANSILPGWIETSMTDGIFANPKFEAAVKTRIPARRWGRPEDFAGVAVYLMSDASAYHTGQDIMIDGGYRVF
jgi:NAD(P)-dependent dehydrogenase (short-subunit alcohol dehydrogenase family)